jgi:hypothetical protein
MFCTGMLKEQSCASNRATAVTMPKQLSGVTFHNGQKMPIVGLGTALVRHYTL